MQLVGKIKELYGNGKSIQKAQAVEIGRLLAKEKAKLSKTYFNVLVGYLPFSSQEAEAFMSGHSSGADTARQANDLSTSSSSSHADPVSKKISSRGSAPSSSNAAEYVMKFLDCIDRENINRMLVIDLLEEKQIGMSDLCSFIEAEQAQLLGEDQENFFDFELCLERVCARARAAVK